MYEFILAFINYPYSALLVRVIIGIVFLTSGIGKLLNHPNFIQIVINPMCKFFET